MNNSKLHYSFYSKVTILLYFNFNCFKMLTSFYKSWVESNCHIYQNLIKNNVEHHHDFNHQFLHRSNLYLFIAYLFRFYYLLISTIINPHPLKLSRYDFFEHMFQYFSTDKDYFFGVTFIMLTLNGLLLEHDLFFHKVDTLSWKLLYDRIVLDLQIYQKSFQSSDIQMKLYFEKLEHFSQLKVSAYFRYLPKYCLEKYIDWKIRLELYNNLEFIDQEKFGQFKSYLFPNVSAKLRIQTCMTVMMLEKVNSFIIAMAC